MASSNLCMLMCLALVSLVAVMAQNENGHNYIDVEPPTFFNYNSPLRQPDSLRSRPYYDFLSTLYRRDADKTQLFRPYSRTRRDTAPALAALSPVAVAKQPNRVQPSNERPKRAHVFRPLFVYRQQQVKRQHVQAHSKRH